MSNMFEIVALMILSQQPLLTHTPSANAVKEPLPLIAEGIASYYTIKSSGRVTASGELLDDDELTCALPAGKFGDFFLIVASNGKSVVCRLNDRGPHAKKRVVDLSEAAMRKLHHNAGLLKVKVYKLGKNPGDPDLLAQIAKNN